MHMMSPSTGIPGNPPWPESRRFNSTIDFDVLMSGEKVKCQGSWENGTLPNEKMGCKCTFKGRVWKRGKWVSGTDIVVR
jgi:hypothetical protein